MILILEFSYVTQGIWMASQNLGFQNQENQLMSQDGFDNVWQRGSGWGQDYLIRLLTVIDGQKYIYIYIYIYIYTSDY